MRMCSWFAWKKRYECEREQTHLHIQIDENMQFASMERRMFTWQIQYVFQYQMNNFEDK